MNVIDIVAEYLRANKYDGLCLPEHGCACLREELAPCGEMSEKCRPGHRENVDKHTPCFCAESGTDHWHIEADEASGSDESVADAYTPLRRTAGNLRICAAAMPNYAAASEMSGNTGPGGPAPCLSIRQPWAWLVAHGWKNIENRTWPTGYRGRFLIHAAKGMTRAEYDACLLFVMSTGMTIWKALPMFDSPQLCRGGIVGEAELVDCVTHHGSEWFTGPYGFVLDNAKPLPFTPCRGALGFFRVTTPPERQSRGGGGSASGVGADTRERFFAHRT